MPKINGVEFEVFLKENARNEDALRMIPKAVVTMKKMFLTAESGRYGSQAERVDPKDMATILAEAIYTEVEEIILINSETIKKIRSVLHTLPAIHQIRRWPEIIGRSEDFYGLMIQNELLNNRLEYDLGKWAPLDKVIKNMSEGWPPIGFAPDLEKGLQAVVGYHQTELDERDRHAILQDIIINVWNTMTYNLTRNLTQCVSHYIAAILYGNRDFVNRLEPLVEKLPSVIPLGVLNGGKRHRWVGVEFHSENV